MLFGQPPGYICVSKPTVKSCSCCCANLSCSRHLLQLASQLSTLLWSLPTHSSTKSAHLSLALRLCATAGKDMANGQMRKRTASTNQHTVCGKGCSGCNSRSALGCVECCALSRICNILSHATVIHGCPRSRPRTDTRQLSGLLIARIAALHARVRHELQYAALHRRRTV